MAITVLYDSIEDIQRLRRTMCDHHTAQPAIGRPPKGGSRER
jgi:hypothetical protein